MQITYSQQMYVRIPDLILIQAVQSSFDRRMTAEMAGQRRSQARIENTADGGPPKVPQQQPAPRSGERADQNATVQGDVLTPGSGRVEGQAPNLERPL